MLPVPHASVLSDWLSVLFSSADRFLWCFFSLGDSGPLPQAGSSAGAERIAPGKALAGGRQDGLPCFGGRLPSFCLYFEVPQGFSYKAVTTEKQNLGLGRHAALACFLGLSDL